LELLRAIEISKKDQCKALKASLSSADLIDIYGDAVYGFCRSLTYSKEDADDLFQETFLKAHERLSKANDTNTINVWDNPQSFLFSTALYLWKSWKRKYARRNRIAPVIPLDERAVSDIDIEDSFVEREDIRLVRQLVDTLPEKYRIQLIMFYTMEWSVSEMAAILAIPTGTVKSRLYKARKLVEKALERAGHEWI